MSHANKAGEKTPPKFTNRLAHETSPYLLQHQHNPVDWYPWGPEAFEKARKENKPIFLSVGYSACHWCHVMEHEVFENEEAANAINSAFISIKVDREERPDIDDIYMRYVHMIGQQGGWPMSVVMTPEGIPFFAGTYFPKPHFMALCDRIGKAWKDKGDEIRSMGPKVAQAMEEQANAEYKTPENPLSESTLTSTVNFLEEHFDFQAGGLQSQRKFPPHMTMELLLQLLDKDPKNERARKMLKLTLDRMQIGGIHDHLAGGFHRYATDSEWFLPHFEKMLYDNAQLARYYSRASVLFKDEEYARTARGIYDWVLREMTSPDGAFYSALDADSEGEEGLFYVWDKKEIDKILPDDASLFCMLYNIQLEGNYHDEATRRPTGLNIPHLQKSLGEYVKELKLDEAALREKIADWKQKLMAVRVKRVWPGLDDKILTSWNALMVGSLARGGMYLKEPKYVQAAVKAADWLLKNQRTPEGRWLATHRKGNSKLPAYLDDHAYLANAFLDLAEATNDPRWNVEAAKLVELMDKHFWDPKRGGYFFTADDHEKLLVRMKNPNDNAIPSGNGVAAQALVRLLKVSGDERYAKRAGELFTTFHTLMDLAPVQVESMLLGLDLMFEQGYDAKGKKGRAVVEAAPAKKDVLKIQRGPVFVEFLSGQSHALAGKPFPFAVKLSMDKGWHVQAHDPKDENAIPTKLRVLTPEGIKLTQEKYPDAEVLKAPELGGEIRVYSGEQYMGGTLPIPADAAGSILIEVEVEAQPCDDKRCLAPEKMRFSITVLVAKDAAEVEPLNEKVLNALKLK